MDSRGTGAESPSRPSKTPNEAAADMKDAGDSNEEIVVLGVNLSSYTTGQQFGVSFLFLLPPSTFIIISQQGNALLLHPPPSPYE